MASGKRRAAEVEDDGDDGESEIEYTAEASKYGKEYEPEVSLEDLLAPLSVDEFCRWAWRVRHGRVTVYMLLQLRTF